MSHDEFIKKDIHKGIGLFEDKIRWVGCSSRLKGLPGRGQNPLRPTLPANHQEETP